MTWQKQLSYYLYFFSFLFILDLLHRRKCRKVSRHSHMTGSHSVTSHDESHDRHGKIVHRPCSSCISSVEKSNENSIEFSLSIAERKAVSFIPAWSLASLHPRHSQHLRIPATPSL